MHLLWKPHDQNLIAALTRLQTEGLEYFVALTLIDDELLILCTAGSHPLLHAEIRLTETQLAPLVDEILATATLLLVEDRKSKMQVRMLQLLRHDITLQQHLGISNGQGQSTASLLPTQHESMSHLVLFQFSKQSSLSLRLSNNVIKSHVQQYYLIKLKQFTHHFAHIK